MKISEDVINVLADSLLDGNKLFLPPMQLERSLYLKVDKALKTIGGKWNRSAKAHIFDADPADIVEQLLQTGEVIDAKKEFQFFETPDGLASRLVDMAEIKEGQNVLEPSAGRGRIAKLIPGCDVIELNPDNRDHLIKSGFNVVHDDFMTFDKEYDVIVANPPFSKQQDIDHVLHMMELAKRVVSVMSASIMWRDNKKTVNFRKAVEEAGGYIDALPDDSFKESGTLVKTCVVVM